MFDIHWFIITRCQRVLLICLHTFDGGLFFFPPQLGRLSALVNLARPCPSWTVGLTGPYIIPSPVFITSQPPGTGSVERLARFTQGNS